MKGLSIVTSILLWLAMFVTALCMFLGYLVPVVTLILFGIFDLIFLMPIIVLSMICIFNKSGRDNKVFFYSFFAYFTILILYLIEYPMNIGLFFHMIV